MSSIIDSFKDKLTTSDKQSGNPQAGDATADPRGHEASKLPFSTKQGQNEQDFPGEVCSDRSWPGIERVIWRCRGFQAGRKTRLKRPQPSIMA